MAVTREQLVEILPDWKVMQCNDSSFDVESHSPGGEDVLVALHGDTLDELAKSASGYYDSFDADEHAAQIYHAKHYGTQDQQRLYAWARGGLEELLDDAKAIDDMYYELYRCLREAAVLEGTKEQWVDPEAFKTMVGNAIGDEVSLSWPVGIRRDKIKFVFACHEVNKAVADPEGGFVYSLEDGALVRSNFSKSEAARYSLKSLFETEHPGTRVVSVSPSADGFMVRYREDEDAKGRPQEKELQ